MHDYLYNQWRLQNLLINSLQGGFYEGQEFFGVNDNSICLLSINGIF